MTNSLMTRGLAGEAVLTCAGIDGAIRWGEGERLEHLFEERCAQLCRQGKDSLAVDGPNGRLTYGELNARANQLARFLSLREAIRPGDRVGLLFDDPVNGYVAMLAVLKVHATYVPLDPAMPPDRITFVASDAGLRMVLSRTHLAESLRDLPEETRLIRIDQVAAKVARESAERLTPEEVLEPIDDLCYVIYTSGTTGYPKGVAIRHASIVNFVRVASEVYGVRPDDRVYQGLTIAFDFSIEEIWVAWMAGATLVPRPPAGALLGKDLHDFLTEHGVTALCCVPPLLATLEEDLPDLRFLLVSGEACPQDLVDQWSRPGRRFLNVYGPTEATVSATWTVLHPSRPVTIGTPLPTYSIVVLDPEQDRALPPGAIGELGIGGIGLAEGYLNRAELTERAFIPDFLSLPGNPSGRIYRTGDLGRVNERGEIEHLGRIDTQVKIRGYRIEVAEIETLLRQVSGIVQAVVDVYEPEPGTKELVAYYTARFEVDPAEIYEQLRRNLPSYMVPAYVERLERLPLTPGGKTDRQKLPPPRGSRRLAACETYVPPWNQLESALAEELAAVLQLERVSVEAHFFDELGANSLLMAQFTARLRQGVSKLPPVSIRDIYLHPTVRRLAATLASREAAGELDGAAPWMEPELPEPIGRPRYRLCGALQLLSFIVLLCLTGAVLDAGSSWMVAARGPLGVYLRAVAIGTGLLLGIGLLPIAAKWLLIGRFKPQRIRVWSLPYFRFWLVKTLLVYNPLPHLLVASPLYALYLRALGARVSSRALVLSQHLPVCADLLSIGPDSVINREAFFNGYRAHSGVIEIGSVEIGAGVFVGERTVLEICTRLHDGAQLGHSSSLAAGQVVPAGQCWYGSPGQRAPEGQNYRTVPPANPTAAARITHSVARLLLLVAIVAPIEALIGALLLTHSRFASHVSVLEVSVVAAAIVFGVLGASLIVSLTIPRLLSRLLKPGRVYPLYGFHYGLQRIIHLTSNNPLLTGLLGDSAAIVHYLRLLGYRFGPIEQTGSNFGLNVSQDVPALTTVGTGTMVSDGLSVINAEFSSTSFRVMPVSIGPRNYIGNAVSYPAASRCGEDCLFGTKAMVPTQGPLRSGVGMLGSPSFEIPRHVLRDRQFDRISSGAERQLRLRAKWRHNLVTMALHVLVSYALVLGLLAIAVSPLEGSSFWQFAATVATGLLEATFMLALCVFAERAVTGFRSLEPRYCSIYQVEFWRHERFWKVASTGYLHLFDGTPVKSVLWRLLGVPVGRRLFDDGLLITERTLVRIGHEATFNMGSVLQSHTLEDGVFKSDHITIGSGCTVGVGALVNYSTTMDDGATLDADAFLMKGSRMQARTRWRGNPATEVWSTKTANDLVFPRPTAAAEAQPVGELEPEAA